MTTPVSENTYCKCNPSPNMGIHKEEILHKESRIKILVDNKTLVKKALDELIKQGNLIEEYIKKDTLFETTLSPRRIEKDALDIVKDMAEGA